MRLLRVLLAAFLLIGLAVAVGLWRAPALARLAVERAALHRGFRASFSDLHLGWGPSLRISRLALARAGGDTTLRAETLVVRLVPASLWSGHPRPAALVLAHAQLTTRPGAGGSDPDTIAPAGEDTTGNLAAAERVRSAAREGVRALLLPARTLPELHLVDVALRRPGAEGDADATFHVDRLDLTHSGNAARLVVAGTLERGTRMPFTGELAYGADDRVTGSATFHLPDSTTRRDWPLAVSVDGRVHQDRRHGRFEILAPTQLRIGEMTFAVSGRLEAGGPAVHLSVAVDSLSGARIHRSLPPPVIGPLVDVATEGTWDYRLTLDLDFARPDSVHFAADVIPHELAIDPARTRLDLLALDRPFVAHVHLPHGRIVDRDLSPANPTFRALDAIDPHLVNAVVTNEDGGFFRHRGFNTDAVRASIAENLKAGAYRRGAGTITMQLARNLWLGHERTLSRKAQEVMLAWMLEHLTGLSKQRLLEIYLNIIEWGPEVHGADEAARWYFGHDASRLTIDEALFLAVIVPSPSKWYWRVDRKGELRPFARAQMHFIGRAMIAKGWLRPEELPPAEQLAVTFRGPAWQRFHVEEPPPAPHDVEALRMPPPTLQVEALRIR